MTYGGSRRADLTQRLARSQRLLKSRLGRPETVLALMRAAHESLDAAVIGEQVVLLATDWFKTPACGVYAADLEGQVASLAGRGLGGTLARRRSKSLAGCCCAAGNSPRPTRGVTTGCPPRRAPR